MTYSRLVILGSTIVYAAIGVGFVVAPQALGALVGVRLTDVTAYNDFRAVYGGVPAGIAVFLAMALRRSDWELPALWIIALTLGGLAASRILSWGVDGWPGAIAFVLHGAEISGLVLCVIAMRHSSQPATT